MKWIIVFAIFISVVTLLYLEIQIPSFLQKYIYPLSMVVTSILLTVIAYLNYSMTQPKIGVTVNITHKDDDLGKQLQSFNSETGFSLIVIAENRGKGIVNPMRIHDDKDNTLYFFNSMKERNLKKDPFGYLLKEGERYNDIYHLNSHYLEIFEKAGALYVEDIRKKKYPISRKELKRGKKYIKTKKTVH